MIFLPHDSWEIKETKYKGRGVFAKKKIAKGTIVGDYLGTVVSNIDFDFENSPKSDYVMYYSDRASIVPADITTPGVHCINHACNPNCWMYPYYGHTLFFAIQSIKPGEELTIHYLLSSKGKDCEKFCTHVCKCESKSCSGTMHLSEEKFNIWQGFYNKVAAQTKRKQVTYNKLLTKLDSYPDKLPINPIYSKIAS